MIKAKEVYFPCGTYGKKMRYLRLGFQSLGAKVIAPTKDEERAVVPFMVVLEGGSQVKCAIDVRIDNDKILGQADGETFYFKTHINASLIDRKRRIFPMPQSLGRMEFLGEIGDLRARREAGKSPAVDVFGVFQGGGMREKAVAIAKSGKWDSIVGIYKPRSVRSPIDRPILCSHLSPAKYFETMAAARIALSFSSHGSAVNPGPWCSFRHVEAWSLGVPLITTPPNGYNVFGEHGRCWIETKADLSDLFDKIGWALEHQGEAEAIGNRGREYFDHYLLPERHAGYVLETIENAC
jgi:glycosyltransferase involved in cell wall biosynthesis